MINQEKEDRQKRMKDVRASIENLKTNISSIREEINFSPDDLFPHTDALPSLNLEIDTYDYKSEMENINNESFETLNCLSSLYLDDTIMNNKNISNIIKNDAIAISDIKFSISCAKRGLINCMKQLDAGANDPEMHVAVNAYQKEIRDSNKMIYDLLNKMKIFYKDLKDELSSTQINTGDDMKKEMNTNASKVTDNKSLNDYIDNSLKNLGY